jgi:hypothetical protein
MKPKTKKNKEEPILYPFPLMTKRDAEAAGYVALTTPYCQGDKSREKAWFRSVLDDMRGCNCVLVEFAPGIEVWRHESEINIDYMGRKLNRADLR